MPLKIRKQYLQKFLFEMKVKRKVVGMKSNKNSLTHEGKFRTYAYFGTPLLVALYKYLILCMD